MHFTGTIWRPPYEWDSLLLEATAGCTHHRCKFCTLYDDLPFPFRMSPLEDVEADLREAQLLQTGPMERLRLRMQGLPQAEGPRRAFLTGANPFVLKAERLERIAELIRTYFPRCETIGCFARITDIAGKTDQELVLLARAALPLAWSPGTGRPWPSWTRAMPRRTSSPRPAAWTGRASDTTSSTWQALPERGKGGRAPSAPRKSSTRPAPAG